ncbi:hypothetical protein GQ53DRAFT_740324 [Thozetella sp. PMI_491]|nr:hypothetical protein GQ53DRAFT_740324 [Thozetella sp. PMI_491]
MPDFIPGLELNRRFFEEAVRPILSNEFPDLVYSAGLLGPGSEVLGFDTEMSMDHDWGVRVFIFIREEDSAKGEVIVQLLSNKLPDTFLGFPVSHPDAHPFWLRGMQRELEGPIKHHVVVLPVREFLRVQIGHDKLAPLKPTEWLATPSHALLEMVAGRVYHDGTGELTRIRQQLEWYPHDLWLYLLAAGWQRISQEEHLMPRAGFVGDELGSALLGSRLVRDIMHLCFLMERKYAPYPKWFGTAFRKLSCGPELAPILLRAQHAATWQAREQELSQAYEILAKMHNALDITSPLSTAVSSFWDRPFQVIKGERFVAALKDKIEDPEVKRLMDRWLIGSVSQWTDNTDLNKQSHREILERLYV